MTFNFLEPVLIAKSNIILDVKPWDDETDMKAMEDAVRTISIDGLLWGAAKLVPLAFGIHKLQISCVVEDDKVSIDWLTEEIEKLEDFVSINAMLGLHFYLEYILTADFTQCLCVNIKLFFLIQVQSVDIAAFNKV